MSLYLYQLSYTAESLAAQVRHPEDAWRPPRAPSSRRSGGTLLGGGFCFGDYDAAFIYEAPDDEAAAAIALAVGAGGAAKTARTTKLLSGEQWVSALTRAAEVSDVYKPSL